MDNEIYEKTDFLRSKLGPTLLSAAIGLKTREMMKNATSSSEIDLTNEQLIRLHFLLEAWSEIALAEGDDVARAWFLGANPWINEDSAITAIREDRFKEVQTAIKAMIEDTTGF